MKQFKIFLILLFAAFLVGNAQAGYLEGGDAADKASADVIVDIAFAIDTSGSMGNVAAGISNTMASVINNLDCDDCDVWAQATFYGLEGTWGGTLFDQSLTVAGAGSTYDGEDNGPAVNSLINDTTGWMVGGATASQDYYKAIVTIGDEGTVDGWPIDAADVAAAASARQAAIDNDIILFAIEGSDWYTPAHHATVFAHFQTMTDGTGGETLYYDNNSLEADLEEIICTTGGGGNIVPEPGTMLLLGFGLLGVAGIGRRKNTV